MHSAGRELGSPTNAAPLMRTHQERPEVRSARIGHPKGPVAAIAATDLVVFGSPTYKATYTGLLKLFLDRIAGGALAGVTAVPVMLGGHWQHAMASDLLLKPVLVELGATCPTRGLFLPEFEYAGGEALDAWLERARPQVLAASQKAQ